MQNIRCKMLCIFLASITLYTYTMRPTRKHLLQAMQLAVDIALGNAPRQRTRELIPQQLTPVIHSEQESPFDNLSKETIIHIISLLETSATTKSLETVGKTINALAGLNHTWYDFITDQTNYLHIIKSLAQRFNCSHQATCLYLSTNLSLDRLNLQLKLLNLCKNREKLSKTMLASGLDQLIQQGIDLNFTYLNSGETPLMLCIEYNNPDMAGLLLEKGCNPNISNKSGKTASDIAQQKEPSEISTYIEQILKK